MLDIISRIADLQENPKPNPLLAIGRECYAFSDLEDKAFALLTTVAQQLFDLHKIPPSDYLISTDAIGNLFVTLYGKDKGKSVMSGSHVDSVYKGGIYDGVAGVHSAFRFLEKLLNSHQKPDYNYTAAVFRAEEASPKTGNTCLGSRIATGTISETDLYKVKYKTDQNTSVPFSEFFAQKYGEKRWQAVVDELQNPPIPASEVIAYEELHIEQSAVCQLNKADVGIVVDGIGGATREVVRIPFSGKFIQSFLPKEKEYLSYKIKFLGEEAHTGGTPPNPTFTRQKDQLWYRKDALVACASFVENLLETDYKEAIRLLYCTVPQEVGFTTVPSEQNLSLAIPSKHKFTFEKYLNQKCGEVFKDFAVALSFDSSQVSGRTKYYDMAVWEAMQIPLLVEQSIREKCRDQIRAFGGVGKVRGTVTDFRFTEDETLACNLDFRDVDPVSMKEIVKSVHERVQQIAVKLMHPEVFATQGDKVLSLVSHKPYVPVDEAEAKRKNRIAEKLGLKVMNMPSLPGHDAASLGTLGVPINVTFVPHNGVSHGSRETMSEAAYQKAESLSHAYLAAKLGVSL